MKIFLPLLLAACPALAQMPDGIIDAHMHTEFTGEPERTSGIPVTREAFLQELKDNGVIGAVSLTGPNGAGYDASLADKGVIFCAGVGDKPDLARIEAGLKDKKYRCMKIYLGYTHRFAYDPVFEPVYQLAEKYGVPVVFHTGDTYSAKAKLKYSDPLTIDEVAVDHPKVNFVLAHCGNPWIESAAELAYKNPNVYLDGSAFLIGDLKKVPPEGLEKYMTKPLSWTFGFVDNPEKLMFGTDWPLTAVGPYLRAFRDAIPSKHWKAVFRDNAAKVFGIKVPGLAPDKL